MIILLLIVSIIIVQVLQPNSRKVLALENGLGRNPPMGWNSWNKFGRSSTDAIIRHIADTYNRYFDQFESDLIRMPPGIQGTGWLITVIWKSVVSQSVQRTVPRKALALLNRSVRTATITVTWSDIGLSGRATVRDLWAKTNWGYLTEVTRYPYRPMELPCLRLAEQQRIVPGTGENNNSKCWRELPTNSYSN